jgi:hypothetical protein
MLYIGDRGRQWSLGILLTTRVELNVRGFQQHLFQHLVMIGLIRLDMPPFRDIQAEGFEHPPITLRAWSQATLDWRPILGH